MKMGFAAAAITPPLPCQMAGYAVFREAQGVHDELYARALTFCEGDKPPVVILGLDVLNLDELCMRALHERLLPLGIRRENLLVCCTHTHASFGGIFDMESGINQAMPDLLGEARPDLVEYLVTQSAAAVESALSDMAEVSVAMSRGAMEGRLATNRHAMELPSDQSVFLMEFLRADGKKLLVYNLSCHPTVLNAENRLLSADFPGGVNARLRDEYDMTLFVNGSAGDMSTRFTRRESSFEECERFAQAVCDKIRELRGQGDFSPLTELALSYRTVPLKEARAETLDTARRNYDNASRNLEAVKASTIDRATVRKAESFVEGAAVGLLKAKHLHKSEQGEVAVQAGLLTVNGVKIVCSPFELFSTLALKLKERKGVEMFGYVNALFGYLADRDAYDAGDYEALMGVFERGAGEAYIDALTAWLS
ncbi:MAG: neutral/alkaline non-lysosomal ceramidase N-terminal domain-containing protein [Clostridiaceae bacterium]|nr:neutral/alkaline non-lysosomal ceramidase N-terminal domain-containing protein [Eubacteriales bacterium]